MEKTSRLHFSVCELMFDTLGSDGLYQSRSKESDGQQQAVFASLLAESGAAVRAQLLLSLSSSPV